MNDRIIIDELEVFFRVGVPDEERARPQRLVITVEMELSVRAAAADDDLGKTVDYFAVSRQIKQLGNNRSWKLIETLAEEVATLVLRNKLVERVEVEVGKFILADTRRVAVRVVRP